MTKNIVLISPFDGLNAMAKKLIETTPYQEVEVVGGDLMEGVLEARKAVSRGAEVIISRGGTYSKILEIVNIPVVEIKLTAFDVFNSFKEIRHIKAPIAIVGYENVIQGYDIIEDLLAGQNIVKLTLDDSHPVDAQIKTLMAKGIEVFVGDTIVNSVAKKYGCKSYMIESGETAIANAIEEAIRILNAIKSDRERMKRYMAVIDNTSDGVIATDRHNRVTVCNLNAEKILGIRKENVIGREIAAIPGIEMLVRIIQQGQAKQDAIQMVGNLKLTLNHIPIIVGDAYTGSIVTFQEISKIQSLEQKIRIKLSEKGFVAKYHFEDIVYRSDVMKVCIERARTFGSYDSSVLITGPSGVGKELFAQSIHNSGMRAEGPFVPINCAALPPSLIESELFGYVEGAFTGAKKGGKIGLFEMAHGGTIFLDEISEMPMDLQGRLLRVIQEREVMRIGGDSVVPVDVRIICATNQALREQVKQHKFRRDLLFRINILSLKIPALHERREDIPELTDQFMEFFRMKYAKERMVLSEDALTYLMHYHYEGNVRELQGMIERAVIVCEDGIIRSSHIVESQQDLPQSQLGAVFYSAEPTLHELEENYIKFIMDKYDHSTSKVCEVLEIDRTTLWRKRKKQK